MCVLYLHTVIQTQGGSSATVTPRCTARVQLRNVNSETFGGFSVALWLPGNLAADEHTPAPFKGKARHVGGHSYLLF